MIAAQESVGGDCIVQAISEPLQQSRPSATTPRAAKVALLAFLFWPFYKTMEVSGTFSLVFVNSAPEKQFANLGQASAFLLGDLR
jgi:hypothetical protein